MPPLLWSLRDCIWFSPGSCKGKKLADIASEDNIKTGSPPLPESAEKSAEHFAESQNKHEEGSGFPSCEGSHARSLHLIKKDPGETAALGAGLRVLLSVQAATAEARKRTNLETWSLGGRGQSVFRSAHE